MSFLASRLPSLKQRRPRSAPRRLLRIASPAIRIKGMRAALAAGALDADRLELREESDDLVPRTMSSESEQSQESSV